jgi:hypothetical protein
MLGTGDPLGLTADAVRPGPHPPGSNTVISAMISALAETIGMTASSSPRALLSISSRLDDNAAKSLSVFETDSPIAKTRRDLNGLLYADGIHDSLYRTVGNTTPHKPTRRSGDPMPLLAQRGHPQLNSLQRNRETVGQ